MRAVGIVIGTRRNQLYGIDPKHDQVANVLLPHRHGPSVIGVGFRPVPKLMPSESRLRCRRGSVRRTQQHRTAPHLQIAQ